MRQTILSRRNLLFQSAAGLSDAIPRGRGASRRPNIVFIMADDLGYGHLGCYGQTRIRTPNVDRMAAEGMRYTQAYAGCTVCAPSRSSLMTGLHTGHTPVRSNSGGVPLLSDELTVAELLKKAGYRTGAFGKWGLGDAGTTGVPNKKGFDEFFGYLHQLHAHFHYTHFLWRNDQKVFLANRHDWRREYAHDLIATAALDFVRKNRNDPFFLYLPFTLPHAELLVPDDSMAEYEGKFPEAPFTSAPRFHYAPNPKPKAALAGMINRLDRSIGQILSLVAELGLEQHTIVFFTSDNGPDALNGNDPDFFQAAGPFRGYKTDLYEGGIRVPLIARWPGRIPAGAVNEQVCAFWDFLPTAAEVARVEAPSGLDGRSMLPHLTSGKSERRTDGLYWEVGDAHELRQAARFGDWKAVRPKPSAPLEIYNLKIDHGERRDLAAQTPDIVRELDNFLASAHRPLRPQTSYPPADGRRYH